MVNFASCVPVLPEIGDDSFCAGFVGCGSAGGIQPTAANLNSVLNKIQSASDNSELSLSFENSSLNLSQGGVLIDSVFLQIELKNEVKMLYGTDPIPAGWALCDGLDGRPYIINNFPIGAGDTYAPGDTGGSVFHSHGNQTGLTTLTAAQVAEHRHLLFYDGGSDGQVLADRPVAASSGSGGDSEYSLDASAFGTEATIGLSSGPVGADGSPSTAPSGHNHSIASDNHLPPYYAVRFIIKL